MHVPVPAGLRRRTQRAILAAALPAAFAAAGLPAAADAALVDVGRNSFNYRADPGEVNNVRIAETGDGRIVVSDTAPIRIEAGTSVCRLDGAGDAICSVRPFLVDLGDRDDAVRFLARGGAVLPGGHARLQGGDGNDTFFAGERRDPFGMLILEGGPGTADRVRYANASFPVSVSIDGQANDGGRNDIANVGSDIEVIEGSNLSDTLFGSDTGDDVIRGLNGNDVIGTGGGDDVIDEGPAPNGADFLNGGNGANDRISYAGRTSAGVNVSLDGVRNDGAPGEQDDVRPSVERITGSNLGDQLVGNSLANAIDGLGGTDTLSGLGGDDALNGGFGVDTLFGGLDDDVLSTVDDAFDRIDCEAGHDTLTRDVRDVDPTGCETVDTNRVGTLALAPKRLAAEAGETLRLRLSWTHPDGWRKLRAVTLRLRLRERIAGRVAIRPRSGRISDRGALEVVRKHTRLAHQGTTVTARLAVRLDEGLAGKALKAEVEATDTRGRRQLERDAGTVRVAR